MYFTSFFCCNVLSVDYSQQMAPQYTAHTSARNYKALITDNSQVMFEEGDQTTLRTIRRDGDIDACAYLINGSVEERVEGC